MFKKMKTNYNMSFLKELLLNEGKETMGLSEYGELGYSFKCRTDKMKVKGKYNVDLYLKAGYVNGKIIYEFMNIIIQKYRVRNAKEPGGKYDDYYELKIRLKDYETYAKIKLESIDYYYEGKISNRELNEFVKIINEMYENKFVFGVL